LGQEAISVGTTLALKKGDLVAPMIRNIGTAFVRGYSTAEMFAQFFAKADSPNRGKDSNLHFSDVAGRGVVGCISHLGPLIPIMTGAAIGSRMLGRNVVTMTYLGEGGCSVGDFHEGLNLAAVQNAPFVLVVENNGWAYSTPIDRQTKVSHLCKRADGYGIKGRCGDGNDVTEVYRLASQAVEDARAGGGPPLLELMTFRRKGPRSNWVVSLGGTATAVAFFPPPYTMAGTRPALRNLCEGPLPVVVLSVAGSSLMAFVILLNPFPR
jgi:TPP-dependent pyruvate/acetoin dehydrogenase alpha subunit